MPCDLNNIQRPHEAGDEKWEKKYIEVRKKLVKELNIE